MVILHTSNNTAMIVGYSDATEFPDFEKNSLSFM